MSNKYSEYLKQVDTMTLEEVETVENEIAEDYKTVVAYNKKMETKKKKADKAK